ncbi:MAG: glutathionylspermidine synthase family protein [Cyanobacteria bacterium J06592_8]
MKRLSIKPRLNWEQKCDEVGFHFYHYDGLYWNESVCYQFSSEQIDQHISKPIFSREGGNVTIYHGDRTYQTEGIYEDEPVIYQAYWELPQFDNCYPVIGSWIIGEQAAGIGIREDQMPITEDTSEFIPHYFI